MRRLTPEELSTFKASVTGPDGEAIRQGMFALALNNTDLVNDNVLEIMHSNGWLVDGQFTELGRLIRDPLREFGFWLGRGRQLPSEDCVPILERANFSELSVLELGSGGGCNLLSLHGIPARLVGIEPMPVYVQVMPVLAELAGISTPEVIEGAAEAIPLGDASFDVVICYSSHQYMDVIPALREMSRVLSEGGRLIIVGNSLYPFIRETLVDFIHSRNLGRTKFNATAILNTVFYQLFHKRFIDGKGGTTSSPIYPSHRFMTRQLRSVGLTVDQRNTCRVASGETVLVATKA